MVIRWVCKHYFLSGAIILFNVFFFFSNPGYAQHQKAKITPSTWPYNAIGYYEYLPPGYEKSKENFPVLFFFHGIGEKGNGTTELSKLLTAGPPKLIAQGHQFPFIVISPQLKSSFKDWYPWYTNEIVEYAMKTLRIDETRVYITGLSLGGGAAWGYTEVFPEKVAALAPICGHYNDPGKACTNYAERHVPIWAFHGETDETIPLYRTETMINSLLACKPNMLPAPIFTIYKGVGHKGAWENAYRTDHSLHNPNLYEWLLQQQKVVVKAGQDTTIRLPSNSITLKGHVNSGKERISSYKWTKIGGPAVTISHGSELRVSLSDITRGTYVLRLTATTSSGKSWWDEVSISVSSD